MPQRGGLGPGVFLHLGGSGEQNCLAPSQRSEVGWEREGAEKPLYHPSFFERHRKSARQETGIWRGGGCAVRVQRGLGFHLPQSLAQEGLS